MGHHTLAVQRGLNLGVGLFIVSEALFFLAIFWTFFHKVRVLWIGAKFRGNLKTLITKLHKEIYKVAPLMPGGIVTSLEILDVNQGMGYRGYKSDSLISVKEQRVDGSSVFKQYCKVYSSCQGNLVFIQFIKYVNTIFESIWFHTKNFYSNSFSFSTEAISSNYVTGNGLNPYYVTGFTDGEGCFYVGVSPNSRFKTGYRVKASFHIGVHIRDLALLEQIQSFFGVGKISKLGEETVQFRVYGSENLKVIINHFDKYPLLTNKQSHYLLFKQVVISMEQENHLTVEGLNKIVSIKAVMNNKLISEDLNIAFPNIESILIPKIKDRQIKSLHWLAGFTDAEGCFFIALKKISRIQIRRSCMIEIYFDSTS